MWFHDILPPSKIPPPPVLCYRNKAQEMRDISKKSIHNIAEKEYKYILDSIRGAAENGNTNCAFFSIKGDVEEIIRKLKHDGFKIDNQLYSEYPHLTISW